MNLRRCYLFLFLVAVYPALQRAAPVTPPSGNEPKALVTMKESELPPKAGSPVNAGPGPKSPAPVVSPSEGAGNPAGKTAALTPANTASTPSSPPAVAAPASPRPGILSAVRAKGPPASTGKSVAPQVLSPRFQLTRKHIGELFDLRSTPPPAFDPRANPFRAAGAEPAAPLPMPENLTPAPAPAHADLALLQQAVATLKVRGVVQRGKLLQLVINSAPGKEGTYKEGDVINILLPPGDPVHLRVRQVSRNSVTLSLGEAEMTLKF